MKRLHMHTLWKKVFCIAAALPLVFGLALSAQAAPVTMGPVSVTIPKGWVQVEGPTTDATGVVSAMFGKADHSAVVNIVTGKDTSKKTHKAFAEGMAKGFDPKAVVTEKNGQYTFPLKNHNVKAICYITFDKDMFQMVILQGNIAAGEKFLNSVASPQYPGLTVRR